MHNQECLNTLTESKRIRINCLIGIMNVKESTGDMMGAYFAAKQIIENQKNYIIQLQNYIKESNDK